MEHETNLYDVCKKGLQALYRGIVWCINLIGKALQLTYQKWYIVVLIVLVGAAAGLYYSRSSNRMYQVDALVILNGPSTEAVSTRYVALNNQLPSCMMESQSVGQMLGLEDVWINCFEAFHVIDCKHDGTADYIDYKHQCNPSDTTNIRMPNRLALRFVTKNIENMPEIEQHIFAYLNADESFQQAFIAYQQNSRRQSQFDKDQIEKLDSLTSQFYFEQFDVAAQFGAQHGLLMGERKVHLFLKDIETYWKHKKTRDIEASYCIAPVVPETHFVVCSSALNGRIKCSALGIVIGWLIGVLVAAIIDERKKIIAYLKR